MNIDWQNFTPGSALAGGALIGTAAAILMLGIGRIAGISGIVGGLLRWPQGDITWRIAFLCGMALAALIALTQAREQLPLPGTEPGLGLMAVAGLLVGIGTRLANGCTSGHGVCGLARRSPRSMAAVGLFMLCAFVTTYLSRHG